MQGLLAGVGSAHFHGGRKRAQLAAGRGVGHRELHFLKHVGRGIRVLARARHGEHVRAHLAALALVRGQVKRLLLHVHGRSHQANQHNRDAQMGQVPAGLRGRVAEQLGQRHNRVLALVAHAGGDAARQQVGATGKQQRRRGKREHGEDEVVHLGALLGQRGGGSTARGDDGVVLGDKLGDEQEHQPREHHRARDCRHAHVASKGGAIGLAPAKHGTHGHKQAEQRSHRTSDRVEGARRDHAAAQGHPRGQRAGDREVGHQHRGYAHHQVGDVVRAVLGEQRLDLIVLYDLAVAIQDADKKGHARRDHDGEEEIRGDGVLRKGVNGLHQTGTGDEGAQNNKDERDSGAEHAPALEAAALAVQGEAVDHGHAGEPAHKARVLHGVPRPEAAPAQHHVGPHGAQRHADGEEDEAEHGDAVAQLDPARGHVAANKGCHGAGERQGHAGVANKGRGRMQDHGPMHQQRVHAADGAGKGAVGVEELRSGRHKGIVGLGEQQGRREQRHDDLRHAQGGVGEVVRHAHAAPCHHAGKDGDEPGPQQKRSLATRPHGGHLVQGLERAIRIGIVAHHVRQAKVAGHKAHQDDENAQREGDGGAKHHKVAGVDQRLAAAALKPASLGGANQHRSA